MAKPAPIVWIAGPVRYDWIRDYAKQQQVLSQRFHFIGGAPGLVRRWVLRYNVAGREFAVLSQPATAPDQAHADELAERYRPMAVLRSDLPQKSMLAALKAMLPAKDIAFLAALSISGGRL